MVKQTREPQPTLGAYVRHARIEAGLSLRQVETLTGVGRMALSRLETGALVQPPTADDLNKVARVLELNETDLFLLAGLPVPKQTASLDIMLRKGYGVPDEAVPSLKDEIEILIARYNSGYDATKPTRKEE